MCSYNCPASGSRELENDVKADECWELVVQWRGTGRPAHLSQGVWCWVGRWEPVLCPRNQLSIPQALAHSGALGALVVGACVGWRLAGG
jgi:hypothetical protein